MDCICNSWTEFAHHAVACENSRRACANYVSMSCHAKRLHAKILGLVPLRWSGSGSVIQDLSGLWGIKRTDESALVVDLSVPDPDRSWITDSDPDHPRNAPYFRSVYSSIVYFLEKQKRRKVLRSNAWRKTKQQKTNRRIKQKLASFKSTLSNCFWNN